MAVILVVEDDPMNREMIRRYLQMAGYQIITAPDGEQALAQVALERPDLIIMDLGLPIMTGWELVRKLKAAPPPTSTIPVIALTAYVMSGDREKALAAGCDDYESKPINFARLLEKIAGLLARS
jgi:CheY-like chemotaxis protein